MALGDLTLSAVNAAINEFDQLGRPAFLAKYGFGDARGYMVQKDGQLYDSKAIAGAAHGHLAGQAPLTAGDFSGGNATVGKTLTKPGFTIASPASDDLPKPGDAEQ